MSLLDRAIASALPLIPRALVHKVASRYIAGETTDDALRAATDLNAKGCRATMDVLGEHVETLGQAARAAEDYCGLLDEIQRRKIDSTVSLKLTQFGLKLDRKVCLELAANVVRRAGDHGNFVRIDMEDSSCTTGILDVFRDLRRDHDNVGVAIQAYLLRTLDDLARLEDLRPNIRLCKGVYVERPDVAYQNMADINRNFAVALERLLRNGSYVGIATHDPRLVKEAVSLIRELALSPTAYEFQMLLGVRDDVRESTLRAGHPVRIYIPFGPDWYAYSVRRLHENPRLAGYVLKALLFG